MKEHEFWLIHEELQGINIALVKIANNLTEMLEIQQKNDR